MFEVKTKEIVKQIRFFQSCGYQVLIPVKSFSDKRLLTYFKNAADGFDISNRTEMKLIPAGSKRYNLSVFSTVTKDIAALLPQIKQYPQATLSLHSIEQIKKLSSDAPFVIRINPYSQLRKSNQSFSRFGLDWNDLYNLDKKIFRHKNFRGFSTQFGLIPHSLNQKTTFLKSLHKFCQQHRIQPQIINLGGGWSFLADPEIRQVAGLTKKLFNFYPWCEPGRALFKDSIQCQSLVTDETRRKNQLYLHIGFSFLAHFRWSIPQMEIQGLRISDFKSKVFNTELWFCGSTCCETDRVGPFWISESALKKSWLNKKIILKDLDGYCLGWNHSFNGQKALPVKII